MPTSTRCLRLLVIPAILISSTALVHAEIKDRAFELALTAGYIHFDTQSGLVSEQVPTVVAGYFFTKNHGAELLYTKTKAVGEIKPFVHTDVDIWRLGYTYNASHREKVGSFFRFGFGRWAIDPEDKPGVSERLQSGDRNMMVYSGGGFHFFFSDILAVRLAATVDFIDAFNGIANADVQATGELGISVLLGGRGGSPAPAATEEAPKGEEKKPEDQKSP